LKKKKRKGKRTPGGGGGGGGKRKRPFLRSYVAGKEGKEEIGNRRMTLRRKGNKDWKALIAIKEKKKRVLGLCPKRKKKRKGEYSKKGEKGPSCMYLKWGGGKEASE